MNRYTSLILVSLLFVVIPQLVLAETSTICLNEKTGKIILRTKCKKPEVVLSANKIKSLVVTTSAQTGPQGERGSAGAQGATGPQGERGPTGATGVKGSQGLMGEQGLQGVKGDKGDDAMPSIRVLDSLGQVVGQMVKIGCSGESSNSISNNVTVATKINGQIRFVCVGELGFASSMDLIFPTDDCSGTPYIGTGFVSQNDSAFIKPSVVINIGAKSVLYEPDYSQGLKSITYNSYIFSGNGSCQKATSSGQFWSVSELVDLNSLYRGPFALK